MHSHKIGLRTTLKLLYITVASLACLEWPSYMLWPVLFSDSGTLVTPPPPASWFVKSVFPFHRFSAVFSPGTQISSVFAEPHFSTLLIHDSLVLSQIAFFGFRSIHFVFELYASRLNFA